MDVSAVLFIVIALALIAATVLIVIQTGFARLSSVIGIMGDGIPIGKLAPAKSLRLEGSMRREPPRYPPGEDMVCGFLDTSWRMHSQPLPSGALSLSSFTPWQTYQGRCCY